MRRNAEEALRRSEAQLTIAQARANRFQGGWDAYEPPVPEPVGSQSTGMTGAAITGLILVFGDPTLNFGVTDPAGNSSTSNDITVTVDNTALTTKDDRVGLLIFSAGQAPEEQAATGEQSLSLPRQRGANSHSAR